MNTFKARLLSIFMLACLLAAFPASSARATGGILRVTPKGGIITKFCGGSWARACTLQRALSLAVAGDQVWVAAGMYKPTTNTDRTISFTLKDGVAIYGGFAGNEMTLLQRDPLKNVTILSGDIGVQGNKSDNSYHVAVGSWTNNTAILDGFTITGGNASGSPSGEQGFGGGMIISGGNPSLANLIFSGNYAGDNVGYGDGAGMLNFGDPTLTNVIFSDNHTGSYGSGGGMANNGNPVLTNVTFSGNTANGGGGMSSMAGNPFLTNVTFSDNDAANGGGMVSYSDGAVLTNVTFSNNTAFYHGGALFLAGSPTFTNLTLSGNRTIDPTYGNGGAVAVFAGSPTLRNTILWANAAANAPQIYNAPQNSDMVNVSYSVIQGGCPVGSNCSNSINANPKLATLGSNGGFTQTMPLLLDSPAIDRGSSVFCPSTDQRGATRPMGRRCDIGAYEAFEPIEPGICDDSHPAWVYNGEWIVSPGIGAYDDTLHGTKTEDSYAYVTFSGTHVILTYWTGPSHGSFDVYIDRDHVDTIDANTPVTSQAAWTSPLLDAGVHTVFFMVTGRGWIDLDVIEVLEFSGVGAGTYDDTDPAWSYTGTWTTFNGAGPFNDTLHQSNMTGSSAEVIFNGAQIRLTYLEAPGRGLIDVYIDGAKVDTIDANNSTTVWQATWTSQMLPPGTHVVHFQNASGSWIDLDALEVFAAVPPVGAGMYDDTDSAWRYTGTWTTFNGAGPFNDTLHQSIVTGSSAEVIFNGAQIRLTYLEAPGRGLIDVYIDGAKVDTIDANNSTTVWQATWTSQMLPAGTHVVHFQNANGSWIDLDALEVFP